ncbi:DUF5343 domain-containing protein [Hyphomicrobium sp.]|uniref:DUF5343 domain-containing protein n=1 Tax=Hyphomicrobium sp. TaxID=82 RepID=UPI002FE29304
MSDKPKKMAPPYATFPAFVGFINKLRDTGVPNRIDRSVFGNASGSVIYSVLASLTSLKMINEQGTPSQRFIDYVKASDEQRPMLLRQIVIDGYPSLFAPGMDLTNMTAGQFNEHIRDEFGVAGSTIDKIASFFLAAAKAADIPVSKHLETRTPIASSPSSRKSAQQRKKPDTSASEDSDHPTPPTPPISEKALEYRLVDLMTEAAADPEVMSAIIKVITFLKTKNAGNQPS